MTPEGRKAKRPEGKSRGKMPEGQKAKRPEGRSRGKMPEGENAGRKKRLERIIVSNEAEGL